MSQTLIDYIRLAEKGINASPVTIWRWERAGRFPKRVRVSHHKVAWVENEIDTWIADRIAARPAKAVECAA